MTTQLYLRSYMMFLKLHYERQNSSYQSFFVVYNFMCPRCGINYKANTERALYERCVDSAWRDQSSLVKNYLSQCVEVQYPLNIISLVPEFFSNDNNVGSTDNRNSQINSVTVNTKIIDRYKNFNIFFI